MKPAQEQPVRKTGLPGRKFSKKSWLACCSLGALGSVALMVMLCVGVILLLGLNENNRTAKMIPAQDTQVFISISPTLQQLPSLVYADRFEKSFGIFGAIPGVNNLASMTGDSMFEDLDIDMRRDILPWIGNEVSLAVFEEGAFSQVPDGTRMVSRVYGPAEQYYGPSVLLSAATRSKGASDAFFRRLYQKLEDKGADIDNYNYKGVTINTISESGSSELAAATYRGLVLVSTNPKVIEGIIDSAGKPKQSLYQQKSFQDLLKRLPSNRLGMLFLDLPENEGGASFDPTEMLLSSVDAVGGSFSLESSGMRFDYLLKYDTDSLLPSQQEILRGTSNQNVLLSKLPGDSIFYFTGQDLSLLFETIITQLAEAESGDVDEVFDQFREQYGVDLREDLLEQMHGEYAVALLPEAAESSAFGGLPAGAAFAIQVKNPDVVQQNVRDLMRKIAEESGDKFQSDAVGGAELMWVESGFASKFIVGCVVNGDVLYFGTSENLLNTLAVKQKSSLANTPAFREAIRELPSKQRFYTVLDVQSMLTFVTEQMGEEELRDFREQYEPYLKDMESLSFSVGKMDSAGVVHGQMRINTK